MGRRIKFYTNEHVARAVVRGLRQRGVDVLTVPEAGMRGASDDQHLERAWLEGRVVFTQDDDFLRLHASGAMHAGIVYASQRASISEIIGGLTLLIQVFDAEEMWGQIEFL
jgi:uncharacterized protein with PIN domain